MAWQLNDVFTDSGSIPDILSYLSEHPGSISPMTAGRPSVFQDALEAMHINVNHINDHDVPVEYEGGMYHWLADDVLELFGKLGLLLRHEDSVELTGLGNALLRNQVSVINALAAGVYFWTEQDRVSNQPYRPAIKLLELLQQLAQTQPPPCPGLVLPEAAQILKMFHQGDDVSVCLGSLLAWREDAISSIPDSAKTAFGDEEMTQRVRVCIHFADDLTALDIYRAQATLIHIIAGALAAYSDLYKRVQYIVYDNSLQGRLDECRIHAGSRLALAQMLTSTGK